MKNSYPPTNEDTSGPYFPISFGNDALEDLTRIAPGVVGGPQGEHIILRGEVFDIKGALATGVLMEFWQANAKGVYATPETLAHPDLDPWFDGYGRLRAHDGRFQFRTIQPGAAEGRTANITITLFSDGFTRLVTQVFFDDESDPILDMLAPEERKRLIAQPDGQAEDGSQIYRFDITLAGDRETPFFDDLES